MSERREKAKLMPLSVRLAELFEADRSIRARDWYAMFPLYSWASTGIKGWFPWWPPLEQVWHTYGATDELPVDIGQDDFEAIRFARELYASYMAARPVED